MVIPVCAQVSISETSLRGCHVFPLVTPRSRAAVYYDAQDYLVVQKVARLFADDVARVTGRHPEVTDRLPSSGQVVIAGTIEKNPLIRRLAEQKKIDLTPIEGAWERYLIQTVERPLPGVDKALVVAGSDRRAVAYGLFTLSEQMGVSPWYWWADVKTAQHPALYVQAPATCSHTPSVKYRGIFLNDEDWGLKPWAAQTFEPERGNIGPRTYAKICELLLRLKANHLAPAMHPVSTAFYRIPENKLVADTFAIVVGSSHCEPLLLNTASEWDTGTMGPWDYNKNRDKINEVLEERVKESCRYENIYTLALRGLHDAAMSGESVVMKDKVRMLEEALRAQRDILARHTDGPVERVPQAFTPYKEVLDIYSAGLELPDDVTLIWADDNFGYLKRLSNPQEQKRSGRAGVYYHVSYLGVPHSYLWFSTTPPALMYEELRKAYDTTADHIWLVNCGDLKGCEMQVSLFLEMAYDMERFDAANVADYPARWMARMFGQSCYEVLHDVTASHLQLCFSRKPEYMGWGYWNNFWGAGSGEKRTDTEFSTAHYKEADRRLAEYERIANRADSLMQALDEADRAACYQLLYYPVKGAQLMNRMHLTGQLYRQYVRQQRNAAARLKREAQVCLDSLQLLTDGYNALSGGKWKHIMSLKQNYDGTSAYFVIPNMQEEYLPAATPLLGLQAEGEAMERGGAACHLLPVFNPYSRKSHWIDLYNRGTGLLEWSASPSAPWIRLSQSSGSMEEQQRVEVSIDWEQVPADEAASGKILFVSGRCREEVTVSLFNPAAPTCEEAKGWFMEENGYVSIPAADFHRKYENPDIRMNILPGLGFEGRALQLGVPTAPLQPYRTDDAPRVEYDFYTFNAGLCDVYTYVLPTFPLHSERDFKMPEHTNSDTKYSVRIDNGSISTPASSAIEYSQAWYDSVLKNCRVNKSTLYVDRPGKHTLHIRCGDPGLVIQKIVIDMGGLKRSYMGPESTQCK